MKLIILIIFIITNIYALIKNERGRNNKSKKYNYIIFNIKIYLNLKSWSSSTKPKNIIQYNT